VTRIGSEAGVSAGKAAPAKRKPRYINRVIAGEISTLTRCYDRVIQWLPRKGDTGELMDLIDAPGKTVLSSGEPIPDLAGESERRTAVLLNGTLNYNFDIQGLLLGLRTRLAPSSRVLVVLYNPYLRFAYLLANRLGLRKGELPSTFITRVDMENLAGLAGFTIARQRSCGYFPWRWLGFGPLVNRLMRLIPILRWLSLAYVVVLRPRMSRPRLGLTCVIPARNERGNIEAALRRFPDLGCPVEIIFVEGHSTDGTWEEIQRVAQAYGHLFQIKVFQQTGKGKADAVRLGFSHAAEPLLTILDADLTMPPETLTRFYDAYCDGHADFINGSRLVYPMEGDAMRFLNRLGNVFFAKALSWVLDSRLGDSLCGTKLFSRRDYERMTAWRRDFGEFDPFGDFELLFPACILGLGVVDVPVRYLSRTYGSTNIHRFRHGFQLLRMTAIGLGRIKLGP
jgi:hypothetical protein